MFEYILLLFFFFFQAEDGIRDIGVTGVQTCALPILRASRPGDAVLSEEAADDPARLGADRVWIIDPLDGTREYGEGREDWAVHVALWDRAVDDLVAGAVALPAQGVVLASDGTPAGPRPDGPPRVVVSRTRPPAEALAVAD